MKQLVLVLLFLLSFSSFALTTDPAELPKLYLAGKQFNNQATLSLGTTGVMMLGNIHAVTGEKQTLKFRVVIKRTLVTDNFPVFVYDIRYNDGEILETVEIEKVLVKTQPGDEIMIVPVNDENGNAPKITTCGGPLRIKVTDDKC